MIRDTEAPPLASRPHGPPPPEKSDPGLSVVRPPALQQREQQVVLRAKLLAELAWFVDRNHLDGTPPNDEGATDADLAGRLSGYAQATFAVRNICAAIRDLGET